MSFRPILKTAEDFLVAWMCDQNDIGLAHKAMDLRAAIIQARGMSVDEWAKAQTDKRLDAKEAVLKRDKLWGMLHENKGPDPLLEEAREITAKYKPKTRSYPPQNRMTEYPCETQAKEQGKMDNDFPMWVREKAIGLVNAERDARGYKGKGAHYNFDSLTNLDTGRALMRYIAENETDPLLMEAREIAASNAESFSKWLANDIRAGKCDDRTMVKSALDGLRRGIDLAGKEARNG